MENVAAGEYDSKLSAQIRARQNAKNVLGNLDLNLRASYVGSRASVRHANDAFNATGEIAAWSNVPRVPRGNPGVVVTGTLTKKNLTDLNSMNMAGTTGS